MKGMTVAVPPGGLKLKVGPNGRVSADLVIHVRFDVCPTWTELALWHLNDAKAKRDKRVAAWTSGTAEEKAGALEREFEASMQAVMAAAIAVDAFHAMVKPHVNLPASLVKRWRDRRTARYSQVTEVLRRAFRLRTEGAAALRQNLKEIYRLRDLAVHPSGRIEAPVLHPELGVGVEWRFAYFRAENAEQLVNAATWILWDLSNGGNPKDPEVQRYIEGLRSRLAVVMPNGHPFASQAAESGAGDA
jgi:hypothetical protein